ncbi:MAG TPA: hypothetical protein VNF99_17070 [Stellaceae bacterium]|nr:hypothetical protein [Stellaceae bacterium]
MILPAPADLLWYAAVFLATWVVYAVAYVGAARLGLVRGVGFGTVVLGVSTAALTGFLSWIFLVGRFSSVGAHVLASATAPLCFLGFCGIWILLGPVTIDRSITLTILSALKAVESRQLSNDRLMAAVPFDRIYGKRLKELSGSGVIELRANGVRVTPKGERVLRLYLWLGRLLNVELQ